MKIVCPNCGTSYDVSADALGTAGRAVRCVRCRETWHAVIDDMTRADTLVAAADQIGWGEAAATTRAAEAAPADATQDVPEVNSPPLADVHAAEASSEWTQPALDEPPPRTTPVRSSSFVRKFAFGSGPARRVKFSFSPPMAIAAMAALVLALIVWRNDVVRLLPQTAAFFQFTGLKVNLRNLAFSDVHVTSETVNGSRVFVIEGAITATSRNAVEIPRLRFVVQDVRGGDVYAWNAVVDQAVLRPGERVAFKSRLASPPSEAHSVVVRFFHRRDLAAGSV
jgi:predicted Zn finger-like uncharacterized protein